MTEYDRITRPVTLLKSADRLRAQELLAEVDRFEMVKIQSAPLRQGDEIGVSELREAEQAYDEFMDGAEERGRTIWVGNLDRKPYREMVARHAPREKNDDDAVYGFNYETMGDELVAPCIVEGEFESESDRDQFLDKLSQGDFAKFYAAAIVVNQGGGPDPKARISSRRGLTGDETSESPERMG